MSLKDVLQVMSHVLHAMPEPWSIGSNVLGIPWLRASLQFPSAGWSSPAFTSSSLLALCITHSHLSVSCPCLQPLIDDDLVKQEKIGYVSGLCQCSSALHTQ